ncbi:MAG: CHAT domain-containing protein [Caldilineaceae bacterium]
MVERQERQAVISEFFAALERREFAVCRQQLAELHRESTNRAWAAYLEGILIFEAEHDFAAAEQVFSTLLATDPEPTLLGRILIALGRTHDIQGQWLMAINTYEQGLTLFAALGQPLEQVKIWKNMAATYQKGFAQGDLESGVLHLALAYCQQALNVLATITKRGPSLTWLENTIWNTVGSLQLSLADWDAAITAYEQGLALVLQLDDHYAIGTYYLNLGEVYQAQQKYGAAQGAYQQALTYLHNFQNPQMEMDLWANLGALYQAMGQSDQALRHYDQALQLVEYVRQEVSDPATRANFFATTIHHYYANAVLCALQVDDTAKAFAYVERARARLLIDKLALDPTSALPQSQSPFDLQVLQITLPDDALVLAYFTTGLVEDPKSRFRGQEHSIRHRFPPAKTLLFALTRQHIRVIESDLSPNKLYPHQTSAVIEQYFLQPELRRLLYAKLVAPVADLLADKRLLYIAPYGPLHYIPFQALLDSADQPLLCEHGPIVIYTPSVSLLCTNYRQTAMTKERGVLAVGYNGFQTALVTRQLRYAEAEAMMVAQLTGGQAWVGSALKKASLLQCGMGNRVLHFSCHGEFNRKDPLASALHIAPNETLSAQEVLQLHSVSCDLVVMSACESGLSQVQRSDELLGLAHAFLHAGANAVIATLWRVDEAAAYLLMARFYWEVQQGKSYAAALHRAQCYLRTLLLEEARTQLAQVDDTATHWISNPDPHPFADPFYWAPFILIVTGQPTT